MTRKPVVLLIAFVLLTAPSGADQPRAAEPLRDYSSQGKPYRPLAGVLLRADSVVFLKRTTLEAFEMALPASTFRIRATVNVQVACNTVSADFEDAVAQYTITVARDPDGRAFKRFLTSIHDYWASKDDDYRKNFELLPAERHVFVEGHSYVLYSSPGNNLEGAAWLFYYRGRLIELRFDRFVSNRGWGSLSSFVSGNLAFQFADAVLRPDYKSHYPPNKFLARYKQGFFVQSGE